MPPLPLIKCDEINQTHLPLLNQQENNIKRSCQLSNAKLSTRAQFRIDRVNLSLCSEDQNNCCEVCRVHTWVFQHSISKRFLPLSPRYRIYGGPNIQIQHFLLNCFFFFSFFTLSSWSYSPQHQNEVLMHERRPIWEAVSCRNTYFSLTWFLVTCGRLLAWQLLLSFLNELLLKNREKKKVRT